MASAVVYVFLHRVIGRILHIAGLVVEIALITGLAAAAAVLVIWTVRAVQRRRAAAGACTTCRFRCQQSLIPHSQPVARRLQVTAQRPQQGRPRPWPGNPQPVAPRPQPGRPRPWPGNPQPTALPPRVPVAQADDRPQASPLVLR